MNIGTGGVGGGPGRMLREFGDVVDAKGFDHRIALRLLSFLRPHWKRMVTAGLLMVGVSALSLAAPYLTKIAIDRHIANGDIRALTVVALLAAAAFVGLYLFTAAQRYLLGWVGQRVLATLRSRLFRHLQQLPMGYHDTHIVGVTISRVINDVAVINALLSQGLITVVGDVLVLVGVVAVMVSMSPRLALLSFSVLPLMILATMLFARRARTAFRHTRRGVAAMVGDLAQNLSGMRVIQAFTQEDTSYERFDEVNRVNREAHVSAMSLSFAFMPAVEFLGMLATAIVLWFGGLAVAGGTLTLGVVVAFISYVNRFFQPIRELSQIYTTMQSAMAGGERVLALLDTKPEVADAPDAIGMPPVRGRVELRGVSLAYGDGRLVLHDIDLKVEPGQSVALVGPTGAGKTSIANLIARFYDATEGEVCIDGVNIRRVRQMSLRRQMGLVPQEPFLFTGTIAENIRFGRPDAPHSEVEKAARAANVHTFVSALPQGYETEVLEGGVNLSLGQRQLLCIARAVLADPRILILDEATASVDTVTEVLIQEALERLLTGRTAVMIAHRLSTIRHADTICVVKDGRIVERGRHDDLLELGGTYRELYEKQLLAQEEEDTAEQ
jgi:ABC-type multidrug transport system fused ATPase/permease subunit